MSKVYKILHNLVTNTFDPELRVQIWRWLVNHSNQKEKEEALFTLWNEMETEANDHTYGSLNLVKEKISVQKGKQKSVKISSKLLRIAAILIVPLLSLIASYQYIRYNAGATTMLQCSVSPGETKEFVLPDGSTVCVNSGSILLYPKEFRGDTRSVFLVGEANFVVKKDQKHPFIVNTSYIKVQALGTKFNVQAYGDNDKIITTLESGAVKVDKVEEDGDSYILLPNEQLEYNYRTGKFEKRTINANNYSAWTKGQMFFINQPLKEILATIQREYAVQFVISNHLLSSDLYTIKFTRREQIEDVMNVITLTVGNLSYEIRDNVIILKSTNKRVRK